MKIKLFIIISYILIFFNSISLSKADNSELKIGLLAPLSGDHKELGLSLLYSLQLALNEIDDKYVHIIPRDSGSNDEKKFITSVNSTQFNKMQRYEEKYGFTMGQKNQFHGESHERTW